MTSRWPPLQESGEARLRDPSSPPRADVTPTPPIELGSVVAGKYRLDRVIGFGGMGIVCAATHLELGTPIAVKFVRPERAADERAAARFLTEARAAAQLQSQYACRVMDCGRLPSGSPYIVMEYLTGQDLRTRVDNGGPLEVEAAVLLALHACEALAEAHTKHIVHRDVKPENLFVAESPGGAPLLKVLDFGISKQLSPLLAPSSLTDSTESMGSPFHMSPEQMLDPSNVDSRTDIWSLGVVLYEILTGQMPFGGETAPQLCANVMTTEPIPPQAHRADIPDGLARVILRCLQKDKTKRYADVGELSQALQEFGGAAAPLAAAHVEQILGRSGALTTEPPAVMPTPGDDGASVVSIPGVPRRGLAMRVGVVLVLVVATGLAAMAVKRAMTPVELEPLPAEAPSLSAPPSEPPAAAPSASASAAAPAPSASASISRPAPRKPKPRVHTEQPAAPPPAPTVSASPVATDVAPDAPPAAAPIPSQSGSAVYPKLSIPTLDLPGPE
jgi:eukaryotic-like serine/threonine-protein kinase